MSRREPIVIDFNDFRHRDFVSQEVVLLAIDDLVHTPESGQEIANGGVFTAAAFKDLSAELLHQFEPTIVVSPVMAKGFDCKDLAEKLVRLGYAGMYRAFADHFPRPAMIEREVADAFPDLDFAIVTAESGSQRASKAS